MREKLINILCLLGGVLIVMVQTPCSEAVSNFSTYIPSFILQNLPSLIQKKQFDTYILILALVLVAFPFVRFFVNWLYKYKAQKTNKLIQVTDENEFLPLNEAIDIFTEYNIKLEDNFENYSWAVLQAVAFENQLIVDVSLRNLLCYAKSRVIILYGQKTKSIQNSQPLNLDHVIIESCFFKSNWCDNFSSLYEKEELLYTNLQVKKTDLDNLVEKYKYPRIDVK